VNTQVFERAADESRKVEERALETSICFHDYCFTDDCEGIAVPMEQESMEGKQNNKG